MDFGQFHVFAYVNHQNRWAKNWAAFSMRETGMPHTRDIPFKTIINSADSVRIRNGLYSGKQLVELFECGNVRVVGDDLLGALEKETCL